MKEFTGYTHGMGIGGWLTNYKRLHVLDDAYKERLTIGDFEHFESYITKEDVKRIASFGVDHIRLCFDQLVVENSDAPFTYREATLKHIDNFISWCEDEKLNVVLNLHKAIGLHCDSQDTVSLLDDSFLQARFIRLWKELEKRYHNKDIVFELMNEVKSDAEKWNSLSQRTIQEIRKLNPKRKIIIGSSMWNNAEALKDLKVFDDENVIYTFHFYNPFEFTHQRGVLVNCPHYYNREMEYPGDIEKYRDYYRYIDNSRVGIYDKYNIMGKEYIKNSLSPAIDFVNQHPDKILYCGEFGVIRHCKIQYRENWFRDVISILKEYGIPYSVWNYLSTPYDGNRFSLVDDDTRQLLSNELKKIINGDV